MGAAIAIGTVLDAAEQGRRELRIRNQERAAVVGRMAAGVAHEILNPLGAISGAVQILRRQEKDLERLGIYQDIQAQIDRVSGTLRLMLDMARPSRSGWALCSVNAILEKTLHFLRFDPRCARVAIELTLDPAVPATLALEDALSQVFLNLAINALDAMELNPPASLRRLTVNSALLGERWDPRLRITFKDSGPGIPPLLAERIFESFFTTKDPGRGSGLGLAVSRHIVEEHAGTLRAQPLAGGGACLVIELPWKPPGP